VPSGKPDLMGSLANAKSEFFQSGITWEPVCEITENCNMDQYIFKGILAQSLATVSYFAPYTAPEIYTLMQSSAVEVGNHCNVGSDEVCTMYWTTPSGNNKLSR
jgi:mannan endo-1,6-alpha-mannosidase